MEPKVDRKIFQVEGMTCTGCETRIKNVLKKLEGMLDADAIFSSSNVYVTYDAGKLKPDAIIQNIERLGYKVKNKGENLGKPEQSGKAGNTLHENENTKMTVNQLIAVGIIVLALYIIINHTVGFNFIPQVSQSMSYGILFVVGLLTSLHCVAMCGGINLSQCIAYGGSQGGEGKAARILPSLLYNSGRVVSYTVIGGIVGGLGAAVSFPGMAKGMVSVMAGVFMVIMGLNMLNIFPWLRKLNPRMPKSLGKLVNERKNNYSPFFVGILNGLMPCGPLQSMQLYALGTGSILAGAGSMFMFSLGTVPLMFAFGAVSSLLSGRFTHRMLKASAVLVMALGIIMVGRGFNLSGFSTQTSLSNPQNIAKIESGIQTVTTKLESGSYEPIVVQNGIPVKWTIKADQDDLNGCNSTLIIPEYGVEKRLVPGENIIEFTPKKEGNIKYTCWMGMISSKINVVGDVSAAGKDDSKEAATGIQNDESGQGGGSKGGCCGS